MLGKSDSARRIDGGCHCGNIRYAFFWPGGETIPVRACGCSFCLKHGGVYTSHPQGRIEVRIADPAAVAHYAFGTRTADFHICRTCGVFPLVTCDLDGRRYAVVNVNTFEGVDPEELVRSSADFEGESVGDRLARRRRNWIADVRIEEAGG